MSTALMYEQKLTYHRLRPLEAHMNQNMQIVQSQHIQFLTQVQSQQGRPCKCSTGIKPNPNNYSPGSPGFSELCWQHRPTVPPYAWKHMQIPSNATSQHIPTNFNVHPVYVQPPPYMFSQ